MNMDISLEDLKVIDEDFYNEILEEWNRVTSKGFGNPQLKIHQGARNEEMTHLTVIIVMQNSSSIFSYFRDDRDRNYINRVHITPKIGKWIGEHS